MLLAAAAGLVMRDPGRGASEGKAIAGKGDRPGLADVFRLFQIPTFVWNTAGMAAVTFATGAYAVHGSNFYQDVRGMSEAKAGTSIGILTAVAGLLGISLGSFLADRLRKYTKRAYLLLAVVVVAAAVPLGFFCILEPNHTLSLTLLFGAMILLSMVLGPCNTVIANVVPANKRASGYATYILLIHLLRRHQLTDYLGLDLGVVRQTEPWPRRRSASSSRRSGLCRSEGENLTVAMLAVAPVLALGCVFFLIGSRFLPDDEERVRAAGGEQDEGVGHFHH